MPPTVDNEPKWDWDLIHALYMGGMELTEIVDVPKFRGLSLNYLRKRASEKKWKDARDCARAEGTHAISRSLNVRMAQAEETHQQWLLDTLENERNVFSKEAGKKGGKEQLERLQIIEKLDLVARKQLGLDNRPALSEQQRNLGILINIQGAGPVPKGMPGHQVSVTLTDGKPVQFSGESSKIEEAMQIIKEYKETEPAERPLPPGFKALKPFSPKGEPEVLVNEKEEVAADIVKIINEADIGLVACDITPEPKEGE